MTKSAAKRRRRTRKKLQKWRRRDAASVSRSIQQALLPEEAKSFFALRKLKYERCLESTWTCQDKPIRAHSIQNARVLDLIQEQGHVVMPRVKLWNDKPPTYEFERVGRNDASTFTGLCAKHDAELFKTLDTQPLDLSNEQHKRLLAYRSVMRELHTQLEGAQRIQVAHEDAVRRGRTAANTASFSALAAVQAFEKTWRVLRHRPSTLMESSQLHWNTKPSSLPINQRYLPRHHFFRSTLLQTATSLVRR
jgi:hypothetical protein